MRKSHTWRCIAAAVLLVIISDGLPGADWPNYGGPDYNGISKEKNWTAKWPDGGPKVLWKASVGTGFASIAVKDGRAYTVGNAGNKDTLWCFDVENGEVLWKRPYAAPLDPKYYEGGPSATPTVDGKKVYTFSKRGVISCFDATGGNVLWSRDLQKDLGAKMPTWGFAGSPFISGNLVILNVGSAGAALNKNTGKGVWASGKDVSGYATPVPFAMGGKKLIALFNKDSILGLNPANGQEVWRFPWKTAHDVNAAAPIISGDKVFISSGYNKGCALVQVAAGKVTKIWQNRNMRNHFNSTVLVGGYLYGVDEKQLRCLDFKTGEVKWTEGSIGKGSLMAADGKLIILSDKGKLIIAEASPDGFKKLAEAQILQGKCWTVPVLSGGKIFARSAKGDVVCVDVSGK